MFLYKVEVKVATNPKMGLGLFTKEFIKKDSVVWEFIDGLDLKISIDRLNLLKDAQKEYFYKYGWIEKGEEDFYYSSCDLSNFANHSYNPNIGSKKLSSIALRDIRIGEELFVNYNEFCFNFDPNDVNE